MCTYKVIPPPTWTYTGSVKLHGTNAGLRRTPKGEYRPQSRNRILDVTCDNYGFAQFTQDNMESVELVFEKIFTAYPELRDKDVTIYGELVGEGIQSGVAVSQLPLHWVLFNLRVGDVYLNTPSPIPVDAFHGNIYNVGQVPLYEVQVDFSDPQSAIDKMNELTKEVSDVCPWGTFRGVEGTGEGIVWIPREKADNSDFWFKTKGEKHVKKGKAKMKASLTPEQLETARELLDHILPDWRLEQGIEYLKEGHVEINHRAIGKFIAWCHKDILKEEKDTIEASDLDWKVIGKAVSSRAREHILNIINTY